jgi:hypothetical protein
MHRRTTREWMAGSFAVALAVVLLVQISTPPGGQATVALRATARWSFVLFWLASAGAPLAALFGPKFRALAQRSRDLGLGYASAHLVHLGLVVWASHFAAAPSPRAALIFFSIGVFFTYLLAILSFKPVSSRLNPRILRLVRTVGVEYIALVFLVDFAKDPFDGGAVKLFAYLPFLALSIAGPLLRLAAAAKRLHEARTLAI